MILLAAVLVIAAIGLLAAGLVQGSATLQWASFAASAVAALIVVAGEVRRNMAARRGGDLDDEPEHRGTGRTTGPGRPERLHSDQFPAVPPAGPPSRPQPLAQPSREHDAQPYEQQPYDGPSYEGQPYGGQPYDPDPHPYDGRPHEQQPYGQQPYEPEPEDLPGRGYESPTYGATAHGATAYGASAYQSPYVPPPSPPADDDTSMLAPAGGQYTGEQYTGGHHTDGPPAPDADAEPPVEEVEVTDLLVVLDLTDEVLVVDEHPRYHLAGCPHVAGEDTFGMPMVEARTDGFTPCGTCAPDRNLARVERARRSR